MSPYERGYKFGQRFRNTVFLAILAWSIGAGATFWWHPEVFAFLIAPAEDQLSPFNGLPIFTAPQDMFGSTLSLSMKGGQIAAIPVLTVGFLSMLKPFVPSRFWRFLTTYTALIIGLFLGGASFVYFVMLPVSLHFLLTFGKGVAVPVILLTEYIALLTQLMLWVGLSFELPIAMQLLSKFRIISYPRASKLRKWVPWVALIFAALITPSLDGTLTMLVAAPILLLYEFGLFFAWLSHPEDGNYFGDLPMVQRVWRRTQKPRNGIVWVVRRPAVAWRRVERKLVEHGLVWWW